MKTIIGLCVFLLLVVMLQNGEAQQSAGKHPTSATPPTTKELTPEQFVNELLTAMQANDEQRLRQLVTSNSTTAI